MKKPKNRSKLRMFLGKGFYWLKKHVDWYFSGYILGKSFAKVKKLETLPVEIFQHQSLLLCPLKDVEMWMQYNKIVNLKLAIKRLDGLVLKPGEIFSYWLLIGKPTKSHGYLPGMVLHNGQVQAGLGGGLCQLSNLLYWMTLHTPLTVIERWRHSYDVFPDANRTQPFGSGATCSYPNIDLQIKNETVATFQLKLELNTTHLVGKWLSDTPINQRYEIVEKEHWISSLGWGGYVRNNKIFRISYDKFDHQKISKELVAENQALMMYEPLLENSKK